MSGPVIDIEFSRRDDCLDRMVPSDLRLLVSQRDTLLAENEQLTMQLTACGVVALSNTPDSAARARDMHPDYMSASCQDVMRVVDSEIALRAELAALKAAPDGVEVVAVVHKWFISEWNAQSREMAGWHSAATLAVDLPDGEPLMTVAQHNAIVASLSPENQRTVPAPALLAGRHPLEVRQTAPTPSPHT